MSKIDQLKKCNILIKVKIYTHYKKKYNNIGMYTYVPMYNIGMYYV